MNLSHDDYDWMYGHGEKPNYGFFGWLWSKLFRKAAALREPRA